MCALTRGKHRGGRCGVVPLGISGGKAAPPLEFRPLLGIPGGALPTAELVQGGAKSLMTNIKVKLA